MPRCPKSIHCFLDAGHEELCRDAGLTAGGDALDPIHLRLVMRDGEEVILGRCPGCGEWGDLDDDQLHGRVSTHHEPGCGWHETKNWWADHAASMTRGRDS